jgi:hypothetical protein
MKSIVCMLSLTLLLSGYSSCSHRIKPPPIRNCVVLEGSFGRCIEHDGTITDHVDLLGFKAAPSKEINRFDEWLVERLNELEKLRKQCGKKD